MNQLEKDLHKLLKQVMEEYWPQKSGEQEGYDAYSKIAVNDRTFFWKIEAKDLNRKHKQDWDDVGILKTDEFADKILRVLGARPSRLYPEVFCLIVPHKRIGNNNTLREDLKSWNIYNKFPFKILVWDFDSLSQFLPHINLDSTKSIYPNAPSPNYGKHGECLKKLRTMIEEESAEGFFYKRSYIRERESKRNVWLGNCLHIKVQKVPKSKYDDKNLVEFNVENRKYYLPQDQLDGFSVSRYQEAKKTETTAQSTTEALEGTVVASTDSSSPLQKIDLATYKKEVKKQKRLFLNVLEEAKEKPHCKNLYGILNRQSISNRISSFCSRHNHGHIAFYLPREIQFADLPIKELTSNDFGRNSDIVFYMEFEEKYD